MASRWCVVLRSMGHLLAFGLANGGQLWPDTLPVVRKHGLAGGGTTSEGLNCGSVYHRDWSASTDPCRNHRRLKSEMLRKTVLPPTLLLKPN